MSLLKKSELIAVIAEETGLTKADVDRVINSLQDTIIKSVAAGDSVKLAGFAAFDPKTNAARVMRSPQTGEPINVPEKKVVKIRPLSVFADAVKNG